MGMYVLMCWCSVRQYTPRTKQNKTTSSLYQSVAPLLHNMNFTSDRLTAKLHFALFSMEESIQMCFIYFQMQLI